MAPIAQVVVVDELLLRGDRSGIERGGHRERLHDRSGLVLARDRRVAEELAVGGGEVVRVVRRVAGHRQDRAGLGVHDHAGRPRGTVQPVGVPDRLLEDVLDAEVQGQAQVGAVDRVEQQRRRVGDPPTDDVLLGAHRPRRPGEQRVFALLDSISAPAFDVDEAEQLGRQRRVLGDALDGVDALGLGKHPDAAQVERADALRRLGADAPLQPDPVALAVQACAELGRRDVEDRRQQACRERRVVDQRRSGEDRLELDRGRQQRAAGVGDLAALGRQLLLLRELAERHRREPRLLDDLPPDQARADRRRDERDDDEEDQGAGTAVGPGEHVGLRAAAAFGRVGWVNRLMFPWAGRT